MHKDALFALAYNDESLSKDVIARDIDVDRLHWLISRQYKIVSKDIVLADSMGFNSEKDANYSMISRIIERIGDHAVNIATNNLNLINEKLDARILDTISNAGNLALEIFMNSIDAFFKTDINAANKTFESITKLIETCEEIENTALQKKGIIAVSLGYIGESIRRVGEYSCDLSEYVINYLMGE
jgi:phosphate uptake regulator